MKTGATICSLLLALAAAPVDAQHLRVRPLALLEENPVLGMRLTAQLDRAELLTDRDYPREWQISASTDLPLYTTADRNPESLRARAGGGIEISLFRPYRPPPGQPPTVDDPDPWNRGWLMFLVEAGAEAAQTLDDADVTFGAVVAYGHDQAGPLWYLPASARIAYDVVFCIECADDADETGWRLDAEAGWNLHADRQWMPQALRPLWLRLGGRAFTAAGLDDVEAVRNEEGLWGSAELAWRFDGAGPLHEIYVRGHGGRLPQRLREKRAVTAGVSLFF